MEAHDTDALCDPEASKFPTRCHFESPTHRSAIFVAWLI